MGSSSRGRLWNQELETARSLQHRQHSSLDHQLSGMTPEETTPQLGSVRCTNCGAPIEQSADFCPRCGARQAEVLSAARGPAQEVKYCPNCGRLIDEAAEICPLCGVRVIPARQPAVRQGKYDRIAAGVFALCLGGVGAQKFYLGYVGQGILCILFSWTGIPSIIALIDGITFLCMSDAEFDARFNSGIG